MKIPNQVSESVRKLNPELFGAVGAVQHPVRQPSQRRQSQDRELDKGKTGVEYRILILSIRRKLVDEHDNLRTGAKPLVDAITASLGFASDDNPRLHWDYKQILGRPTGTVVLIERNRHGNQGDRHPHVG